MSESVLIVGAGPVGLMAALWLTRLGVSVRVVEKKVAGSAHSKALAVHANSLELLQRVDAGGPFLDRGLPMRRMELRSTDGRALFELDFHDIDSPYNYALIIEQAQTEALLRDELARDGVQVEWGTELVGLAQTPQSCCAQFADGSESEHAYVIGCDGGPSTVRQLLDIPFEGEKQSTWFVLADTLVDWDERPGEVRGYLGEDGVMLFFPLPEQPWHRIIASLPDDAPDERPTLNAALFEGLAARRCPVPCTLGTYRWQSAFQVRRQLADRYRSGRAFIAGDAAHTHSPVGGQGMNTGFADVANLCWKIAAVMQRHVDDRLLDTYESERRPVAKATLFATQVATDLGTTASPVLRALRDQVMQLGASIEGVRDQAARRGSMTEFVYSGPQFGHGSIRLSETEVTTDPRSDTPSVAQRFEFARGPHPGHRAPDLYVSSGLRLLAGLGPRHALLLFDGTGPTDEGYQGFERGCRALRARYPWITPVVVTPNSVPDDLAAVAQIIRDPDLHAHRRYGASSEAAFLVRPDNYIAWRSQPSNFAELFEFLS